MTFRSVRAALAATFLLCLPACPQGITAAQWQSDLRSLVSKLQATHPNVFFHVSAEDFNAAVSDLNQRIPQLSDIQIKVEMMKLVAMIGDAHTHLDTSIFAQLPIRFRWFRDGLFVTAAPSEHSRAPGARVIEIGNMPVSQALEAISTVIAHENNQCVRDNSQTYFAMAEVLAALGITSGPAPVRYLLEDLSGDRFEIQVSSPAGPLVSLPDGSNGFVPLWRRKTSVNYWYEYLPAARAMYLAYNMCQEIPSYTFTAFLNDVLAFMRDHPVDRVVVDFRNNPGGNNSVFWPMRDELSRSPDLRSKFRAIIGPATYSSGVYNASELAYRFGIPLIGEPTGGKPSCYGNTTSFVLPYSRLTVYCSTQFFVSYPGYTADSLLPDVPVYMSSADYFARHDPALLAALSPSTPFHAPQPVSAAPATVNAASFGSPVAPGGLASVFGDFSGVVPAFANVLPLPTTLGGIRVEVNGVPAPLLAAVPWQINFQVPSAAALGTARIDVIASDRTLASGSVEVTDWSPGVFLADFLSIDRPGAILTEDYRLTDATFRARRNQVIQVYATGASGLNAGIEDGAPAPLSPLVQTAVLPRVFIGSDEAQVEFSGAAPGYVGLWQINVRVPDTPSLTGMVPLVVLAPNGYASNAVTFWME